MSNTPDIIRTFWHGNPLSIYEILSLKSFVKYGHVVELYSYTALDVPKGVTLRDANKVLPETALFLNKKRSEKGSVASFSDLFRYAMLYQEGGCWVDTDVLCLRPFSGLPEAYAGYETKNGICNAILKFNPNSPICDELYKRAEGFDKSKIQWGEIGPYLVTEVLAQYPDFAVLPISAFFPIPYQDAWKLITPSELSSCKTITKDSYCVHWWNEIFKQIGMPKKALPPNGSFLHEHALKIFEGEQLEVWDEEIVQIWLRNYGMTKYGVGVKGSARLLLESIKKYI